MTDLERAVAFAREAHAGQTDKLGRPYIDHCLRVMDAVSEPAKRVAVLHGVVEDTTDWGQLRRDPAFRVASRGQSLGALLAAVPAFRAMSAGAGITVDDLTDLADLTRWPGVRYSAYIGALAKHGSPVAREVKVADLRDNLGRWVPELGEDLRKRYERALARLTEGTADGG